jgi:hypothetical protein
MKLMHPPQVVGGHVQHFDVSPLIVKVEKCILIEDVLQLLGVCPWTTAMPPGLSEEDVAHARSVTLERVLEGYAATPSHNGDHGHSDCAVCRFPGPVHNYQIKAQSMPEKKELIQWGTAAIIEKVQLFPEDVESVLDALLLKWCQGSSASDPLVVLTP